MLGASTSPYCFVDADYFQRDHKRLVDIYREIKLLEEAVDEGVHDAPARLSQAKTHTGFSFGNCNLLKLPYLDLRNFVRLPPAHQWLLGIIKKDIWGGFYKLLGPTVGTQWMRRCDERKLVRFIGPMFHVVGVVAFENYCSF